MLEGIEILEAPGKLEAFFPELNVGKHPWRHLKNKCLSRGTNMAQEHFRLTSNVSQVNDQCLRGSVGCGPHSCMVRS